MAAYTDPNSLTGEHFLAQAELHQPEHLVGGIVHGLDKGAAVAAAPALVTAVEIGAAALRDLGGQVCKLYR